MNKFKMVEYLGIAIIALPVTAAMLYFVLNKKGNSMWEQPQIENVDSIGNFVLVEPVNVEVKKIETLEVKKEPIKKVDSIVRPKEKRETVEEPKTDTSNLQADRSTM
jgi:hypothetical protein